MKLVKTLLIISFAITGLGFTGYYILVGVDDDGATQIDPLETAQPDEELGFKQVANLIEGFVSDQFSRRKLAANLEGYQKEDRSRSNGKYSEVYKDLPGAGPYATRDVHRKTNGCFRGNLTVSKSLLTDINTRVGEIQTYRQETDPENTLDPLPERIADSKELGVFQPGANYDSIVRFSNGHPKNQDDRKPDARGFAVKILPAGTIASAQPMQEQNAEMLNNNTLLDILTINFPTFFVNPQNTALKYYEINQKFLAGALDFSSSTLAKLHEADSLFTSGINGLEVQLALSVNGSVIASPLYQEYYSMVPSRLGLADSNRAVKYYWAPAECPGADKNAFEKEKEKDWPKWANERYYANPLHPQNPAPPDKWLLELFKSYPRDFLRANVQSHLQNGPRCFDLYFQLYADQKDTNIEDSTDIWLRNEGDRSWWLNRIVPSRLSPYSLALPFDRSNYIQKIKNKKAWEPVYAAKLTIDKLDDGETATNNNTCEDMSFNPWNGDIAHHKPLGVISRLKRRVYDASRRMRHMLNGFRDTERSSAQ